MRDENLVLQQFIPQEDPAQIEQPAPLEQRSLRDLQTIDLFLHLV
jgi:hypothetical protein